ncbi:hypothetical protein BKA93DRAFT_822250 [Sparassis latifolia]
MPSNDISTTSFFGSMARCIVDFQLCPGYALELIRNSPHDANLSGFRAALLHKDDVARRDVNLYWALQRLSFVHRPHCTEDDPFEDIDNEGKVRTSSSAGSRADTARRAAILKQLTAEVATVLLRQHRCFVFTVLILGDHARFIRWDRAGAVVTEKFNYKCTPYLARFLRMFAQMSPEQQGADPTAVLVENGSQDFRLMMDAPNNSTPGNLYARDMFYKSLEPGWAWWKLSVPSMEGENNVQESREFLVGKPHFLSDDLQGRATRGYVALDCSKKHFVFLKDAWRVSGAGMQKEGDALRTLQKAGVTHVPTLVCHGDIGGQISSTQEHVAPGQPNDTYVHYRLVVEQVCRPIHGHRSGLELVRIIADCVDAHQQAVEKAGLMHCDVSVDNILMVERPMRGGMTERRGILCDWELSKPVRDGPNGEKEAVRVPGISGTWAYMSVHALDHPEDPITVADELEAFYYVLFMSAIYCMKNNISDVENFVYQYFDSCGANGRCGSMKRQAMLDGRFMYKGTRIKFTDEEGVLQHPLNDLLPLLSLWFSLRYGFEQYENDTRGTESRTRVDKDGRVLDHQFAERIEWCMDQVTQLKTHDAVRRLLEEFLDAVVQPGDDKRSIPGFVIRKEIDSPQERFLPAASRKRPLEEESEDLPSSKGAKRRRA